MLIIKVPSYIKENQKARKTTVAQMQVFVDYINKGKKLYWYNEPLKMNDEEYSIMSDWERLVTETFIGYLLQDDFKYKLGIKSNLDDLKNGDYIIYSTVSDVNNEQSPEFKKHNLNEVKNYNMTIYSLDK